MDHEKKIREIALHASQSCETRTGRFAGTVALEQLPLLPARRRGSRQSQPGLGQDFFPRQSGVELSEKHSPSAASYPPSHKTRERGTLSNFGFGSSKAGPPALDQCRDFFRSHPQIEPVPFY